MIRIGIFASASGLDAKSEPVIITTCSTELNKQPREKNTDPDTSVPDRSSHLPYSR